VLLRIVGRSRGIYPTPAQEYIPLLEAPPAASTSVYKYARLPPVAKKKVNY